MSDYIKREDTIKAIESEIYRHDYLDHVIDIIEAMPSADVTPVRYANHGRWKNYKDEHTCSVCDYSFCDEWYSDDDVYNYCPNCGARMDEGNDNVSNSW